MQDLLFEVVGGGISRRGLQHAPFEGSDGFSFVAVEAALVVGIEPSVPGRLIWAMAAVWMARCLSWRLPSCGL